MNKTKLDIELSKAINNENLTDEQFENVIRKIMHRHYINLHLSERQETKLHAVVTKQHEKSLMAIFTRNEDFLNSLWGEIPKERRAEMIWSRHYDCPKSRIGRLCHIYGISSSYYRELRELNHKEWLTRHIEYLEDMYYSDVVRAAQDDYDAPWQIEQNIIGERDIADMKELRSIIFYNKK